MSSPRWRLSTALLLVGIISVMLVFSALGFSTYRNLTYDWASLARQGQSMVDRIQAEAGNPLMYHGTFRRDRITLLVYRVTDTEAQDQIIALAEKLKRQEEIDYRIRVEFYEDENLIEMPRGGRKRGKEKLIRAWEL